MDQGAMYRGVMISTLQNQLGSITSHHDGGFLPEGSLLGVYNMAGTFEWVSMIDPLLRSLERGSIQPRCKNIWMGGPAPM